LEPSALSLKPHYVHTEHLQKPASYYSHHKIDDLPKQY